MKLFDLFKKKQKKIKGRIGYYGLDEWWLTEFTDKDREYVQKTFKPLGFSSDSLTGQDIRKTNQSAIRFLSELASWFSKTESRYIAYKLIEKAELLIDSNSSVSDIHFLYGQKIEITYKDRDLVKNGLEKAIEACKQQISYSEKASIILADKFGKITGHKGFEQLAIIYEKQKDYKSAISISKEALSQGWSGTWEKRINRCESKLF